MTLRTDDARDYFRDGAADHALLTLVTDGARDYFSDLTADHAYCHTGDQNTRHLSQNG